ncbi:hypothetical protein PIB30_027756 [Stylosanthes scabra]|uniref:Uncharacterized protein n=1 Tax=Stylosanthes scabra TaxID=79078 RepID=A0ABU6Y7X3_9FABA|nr:hypothetical protein [Stylosanthes scabra]
MCILHQGLFYCHEHDNSALLKVGQPGGVPFLHLGIDKEKKLGAKDNLKKKKQVKNYRVFEEGYRYLASGYRYPSTKLAQTKSKHESGVIQAQFHVRTAFWPRLGVGFHNSPRLGVAGKPTSTPDRVTTK